ncbi:MAG: M56 family metallopeptidase [Marinosulfonomonas sp.]|nr:M56 family metallopeptidase [Marinosulfonomonas sp.]
MIQASSIFNTYININILLVVSFSLWLIVRFILNRSGMKYAYSTQLRLLNCVFLAILFSPLFVLGFNLAGQYGALPAGFSLNLSDFVLAQYLNGSFEMQAVEFEQALRLRDTLRVNLLQPTGWLGFMVAALMIAGCLGFFLRCVIAGFQLRNIIGRSYPWRRFGTLHLRLSDTTSVPFSARSLRKRYIVIPSAMLSRSEDLKIALAHEFQHFRQRDVEWEIGLELLKSVFFWNPVIYFWKRQIEQLRELACDQQVLQRNHINVRAYCDCLLRVCRDSLANPPRDRIVLPSVALVQCQRKIIGVDGVRLLQQRIESLCRSQGEMQSHRPKRWLMAVLIGLIAVSTIAIQDQSDWSQDRLMLSSIVNLERLEALNKGL